MKNIRLQTIGLGEYLRLMKDENIRTDQECQRLSGQWNANMVNELIATVLTDNYIPPIILGEETINGIERQWIIDGLQRSSSLSLFRYGNKRITKNLDEYMVTYQRKVTAENGNIKRDEKGEIVWETVQYDIRNKTYEQLPEELKSAFNCYQITLAIHQKCDTTEISKLVRKYNNHKAMNQSQKAFTYLDAFAKEIREVAENRFFFDVFSGNSKARKNGTIERAIGETVLISTYPEHYRKNPIAGFKWLNENGTMEDFYKLGELLTRLTNAIEITIDIRNLFDVKNVHIFVTAFKAFIELGREDKEFGEFLQWFVNGGNATEINGKVWAELENDSHYSTKDYTIIRKKIDYLVDLMNLYFREVKKSA